MLYFTSDPHIQHRKILEYEEPRRKIWGDDISSMNEGLIEKYNKVVKDSDTCWFLGDISLGDEYKGVELFRRMRGHKFLILGNHDKGKDIKLWKTVFEGIFDYKEISYYHQKICLFHFGQRVWNKHHHGSWHLHGHSHGSLPPWGKSVDVGVDATWITGQKEFRPYSFDEIKEFMDKREPQYPDKHQKK